MMMSSGFGLTTREALSEKQDMQELNDKLAAHMQRFHDLKKALTAGGEVASYAEAMKQIEAEVNKMKDLYDGELNKLRRKLDEANREKNRMITESQKMGDVNGKLNQALNQNRKLEDQVRALEKALAESERQNADLRAALMKAQQQVANSEIALKDNDENKRRLNEALRHNKDLDAKIQELNDKLHFDQKRHENANKEMNERIKAANDIIQALENKLKQLNKMGENLPAAIAKMRDGTVAEMRKFQKETEDALNKNIDSIKRQLDEDAKKKDQLAMEKRHLEETLRKIANHNADLEAKVKALEDDNKALKNAVDMERAKGQVAIKDLEKKLKELQDNLLASNKDFNQARDAQASLRAEIETYRRLLEGDSNSRPTSRTNSMTATSPLKTPPSYGQSDTKGLPALNGLNLTKKNENYKVPRAYQSPYNGFNTTYRNDYTPKIKGYY